MPLQLVITDAGRAAITDQANGGFRAVRIASVGVSPNALAATEAATALPGEVKRITAISGEASAANVVHLTVQDESNATYTVRSFALYLNNGTLFAIYGQADPIVEKSAQALLMLAIDITLANIPAPEITFGDANFIIPPATTARAGVVELATDAEVLAGTDDQRAATPKSLRAVFARLAGALFTGAIGAPSVRIIPTVNPTSAADITQLVIGEATDHPLYRLKIGYWSDGGAGYYRGSIDVTHGGQAAPIDLQASGGLARFGGSVEVPSGYVMAPRIVTSGTSGEVARWRAANPYMSFFNPDDSVRFGYIQHTGANGLYNFVDEQGGGMRFSTGGGTPLIVGPGGVAVTGGLSRSGNQVWDAGNDGAGSGLDADLLDGRDSSAFLIRNEGNRPIDYDALGGEMTIRADPYGWALGYSFKTSGGARLGGFGANGGGETLNYYWIGADYNAPNNLRIYPYVLTFLGNTVWHAGNDGAGSGCDADLLDGQQGSWYTDIVSRLGFMPIQQGGGAGQAANKIFIGWSGGRLKATVDSSDIGNVVFDGNIADVWRASNDGAGSGLDADLLDGRQASDFALLSGASFSGQIGVASPGSGQVALSPGTGTNTGFIEFKRANGVRDGYIGFAGQGGYILLQSESGLGFNVGGGPLCHNGNLVWDAANDGSGSGLDADLLDGWDRDAVRDWNNLLNRPGAFNPTAHGHGAGDIASAFPWSANQNGYLIMPNGMILNWCMVTPSGTTEGGSGAFWPLAFPNYCLSAQVSTYVSSGITDGDVVFQLLAFDKNGASIMRQSVGDWNRAVVPSAMLFGIGY